MNAVPADEFRDLVSEVHTIRREIELHGQSDETTFKELKALLLQHTKQIERLRTLVGLAAGVVGPVLTALVSYLLKGP